MLKKFFSFNGLKLKNAFSAHFLLDFFTKYVIIISFCETVFIEPPPTALSIAIGN